MGSLWRNLGRESISSTHPAKTFEGFLGNFFDEKKIVRTRTKNFLVNVVSILGVFLHLEP